MTNSRKARADSKEEAVKTFIAANKVIVPPANMRMDKDQLTAFHEVIAEFAKIDWTEHSIRLAAVLARTLSMLSEAQEELDGGSFTAMSQRGTPVANPLISVTNQLAGQVMSLRRTLALHAMASGGKREQGKRKGYHKAQEEDAPDNDEDLIPTPSIEGHA